MAFREQFEEFPILQTNRLILREFGPDDQDAEALFRLLSDAEGARYFGNKPMESKDLAVSLIRKTKEKFTNMEMIRWAITEKQSNTVIGMIIARDFELEAVADLEYILLPEYWGKGMMTEALKAVIAFGFHSLGLIRIQAKVMPENAGSVAVLKKIGFHEEGLLRQYPFGRWITDTLMFSLLKKDLT